MIECGQSQHEAPPRIEQGKQVGKRGLIIADMLKSIRTDDGVERESVQSAMLRFLQIKQLRASLTMIAQPLPQDFHADRILVGGHDKLPVEQASCQRADTGAAFENPLSNKRDQPVQYPGVASPVGRHVRNYSSCGTESVA